MTEQQLQDYANGLLPPAEAEAVSAAIAGDPELARKASAYERMFAALRRQRLTEIETELASFTDELPLPGEPSPNPEPGDRAKLPRKQGRTRFIRWFLVAAAVALLVFAFWPSAPSRAEVAATYFEKPRDERLAAPTPASRALLGQAIDAYYSGDYAAAAASFSALKDSAAFRADVLLYLPHALHEAGELAAADLQFEESLRFDQFPAYERELLRWNAMINDLARGEDITQDLAGEWSTIFDVEGLREASANLR